jgi:endonuclease/exonuclease/phosphatase (EEP) superfamily protein YafD
MNRLTKNTTLTDSRIGFGIQNSWNAKNILFSIAIDHCFITNDFNVINRKIGPYIGSDHYPISVTRNFK